jgi:hypothetical protein
MPIKKINVPSNLIRNYPEKSDFIKKVREKTGFDGKKLNNGACEAITLILSDFISVNTKNLFEKLSSLQKMFLVWYKNTNKNKPPLFDKTKYGSWLNFSYRFITDSSTNLIVRRVYIKEIDTVQNILKTGVIFCGNLVWGIDRKGMPPLHSFSITNIKDNELIIVGDLNEKKGICKGFKKENLGSDKERIVKNVGISKIDINRIDATISINNFNKQGYYTGNVLYDYFMKNYKTPKDWRYPLFTSVSLE